MATRPFLLAIDGDYPRAELDAETSIGLAAAALSHFNQAALTSVERAIYEAWCEAETIYHAALVIYIDDLVSRNDHPLDMMSKLSAQFTDRWTDIINEPDTDKGLAISLISVHTSTATNVNFILSNHYGEDLPRPGSYEANPGVAEELTHALVASLQQEHAIVLARNPAFAAFDVPGSY